MGNGSNELDEKGCEFGRKLKMRVDNVDLKAENNKEAIEDVDDVVRNIEKAVAKQSGKYIIIASLVSTLITLAVFKGG